MKANIKSPNQISVEIAPDIKVVYNGEFKTVELIRVSTADVLRTEQVPNLYLLSSFLKKVEYYPVILNLK